ncbi:MAG: FMN-binding negative transcriptional regulator [Sphingomonas sp.]|jgi:transcriptional regulator
MHPNPAFRSDTAAMLRRAAAIGFAHLFLATTEGPMVVHAPITLAGDDAIRFHVARGNRAFRHLDGARVLASVTGPQGYVTPNWYADPMTQVPTWNYLAVEIEGPVRALGEDELIDQLDTLAAEHEPRVIPDNPWTRAKMDDARFRAILRAIGGFELTIDAARSTSKLSQNKSAEDRARVIAGLLASGNATLATAMQEMTI